MYTINYYVVAAVAVPVSVGTYTPVVQMYTRGYFIFYITQITALI